METAAAKTVLWKTAGHVQEQLSHQKTLVLTSVETDLSSIDPLSTATTVTRLVEMAVIVTVKLKMAIFAKEDHRLLRTCVEINVEME